MSKPLSAASKAGCFLVVWSMMTTTPMWLILLFFILQSLGDSAPVIAWVIYYAYVPCSIIGVLLGGFWRLMSDEG